MPKKHYRAEQRKTLRLQAKREGISLGELQKRLKSDGDTMEQEAGEGLWTATEAGQDGAAEEGGNGMDDSASLSLFVMATSPPFPLVTMPPLYSAATTTLTTGDGPNEDRGRGAANEEARWLREICRRCSPAALPPPFPLVTTLPLYSAAASTSTTCDSSNEDGGREARSCSPVMAASPPFPLEMMPPLYSTAATTSTTADCPDDDGGGVAASVVARRLLKRAGVLRLEASTTKRALQDGRRRQKDAIDVDTDRIIELLMLLASSSDGVAAIAVAVGPSSSSSLLLPQLILPLPNDSFFYKFYWTNPSETSLHPSAST